MIDSKFRSFIINLLRQGTYKWKARGEAQKLARIHSATFQCNTCGDGIYTGKKTLELAIKGLKVDVEVRVGKIKVDHIDPVVGVEGFISWDEYIPKMFCDIDNLQIQCDECHKYKSKIERELRKEFADEIKAGGNCFRLEEISMKFEQFIRGYKKEKK